MAQRKRLTGGTSRTSCRTSDAADGCGNESGSDAENRPREVFVLGVRQPVRVSGTREQRAAGIASHQTGRANRRQLMDGGVTDNMIEGMLGAGYLIARLPGVYAVGHIAPAELARETEALLASSSDAWLSHLTAASLWRMRPRPRQDEAVEILIHRETRVRHHGIHSHRTRQLDPKDVRIHRGLPVTSPARTLLDCAARVELDELEQMLDEALRRKIVRLSEIRELLGRCGNGRPGAHRLAQLLQERQGRSAPLTRSYYERRLRDLLRKANIQSDEMNTDLFGYVPDFVWRDAKLIVEIDGWEFHQSRAAFERDRRKDAQLATEGWLTLRFTARRIRDEPYAVIAEIALMLGRRRRPIGQAA